MTTILFILSTTLGQAPPLADSARSADEPREVLVRLNAAPRVPGLDVILFAMRTLAEDLRLLPGL